MLADCKFGCGPLLDYVAQINDQPINIDTCNKILAISLEQSTNIHKHKITFETEYTKVLVPSGKIYMR